VQSNYFRLYAHYLYFNVARFLYVQLSNFVPVIAMAPTIAAGAITFGIFQQISNAFSQVEDSLRFLANSWTTIISLISVYKRLRTFESNIPADAISGVDYDDPRYLATETQFAPPATTGSGAAEIDPTAGGEIDPPKPTPA
jgi:peptide/bleomycin uptake transporter